MGFNIKPIDIRGIGIHIKREQVVIEAGQQTLDRFQLGKRDHECKVSKSPIKSPMTTPKKKRIKQDFFTPQSQKRVDNLVKTYGIDPMEIDDSVLEHLPPDIAAEVNLIRQQARAKHLLDFYEHPTLSQVDRQVFEALPKDIQKEMANMLKKTKKPIEPEVKHVEQVIPQLFGETDFIVIQSWIYEWITEHRRRSPHQQDTEALGVYLEHLTLYHLEQTDFLCKCMIDLLQDPKGKVHPDWFVALEQLLSLVNQVTLMNYQAPFYLFKQWKNRS